MRHYSISEVKLSVGSIISKVLGLSKEPVTDKELDILIFSMESGIIFDSVGERIVPALESIPKLPSKPNISTTPTTDEKREIEEYKAKFEARQQQIKSLFSSALRESIMQDIRARFGS